MNDATIKVSHAMRPLAEGIDGALLQVAGERVGFTLIVYTEGRASYISNVTREESIREMKKLISLWEQEMPDIPAHEYKG